MIKASRVLSMIIFFLNLFDYFSFSTLRLSSSWDCSNDLLVRFSLFVSISFNSWNCISGLVLLCFFLIFATIDILWDILQECCKV